MKIIADIAGGLAKTPDPQLGQKHRTAIPPLSVAEAMNMSMKP